MPSSGSSTAPIITPRYLDIDGSRPTVVAEPLTPEAFAPFGSVISPGHLGADASNTAAANQGTAVKFIGVSHSRSLYSAAPSGKLPQQTNWNLFRCSPPTHLFSDEGESGKRVYLAKVLEQHPYSSQTFLPLGRNPTKPAYIVIVSLKDKDGLPDLSTVRAFIATGAQAVTYGAATWHAPMVAIDSTTDFAVLINENGVPEEDCQEVYYTPGFRVDFSKTGPAAPELQSQL